MPMVFSIKSVVTPSPLPKSTPRQITIPPSPTINVEPMMRSQLNARFSMIYIKLQKGCKVVEIKLFINPFGQVLKFVYHLFYRL